MGKDEIINESENTILIRTLKMRILNHSEVADKLNKILDFIELHSDGYLGPADDFINDLLKEALKCP